jgi:hypothetical protein
MNRTLCPAVILSEAKNLGSILDHRPHGNELEKFESPGLMLRTSLQRFAQHDRRLCVPKFLATANLV